MIVNVLGRSQSTDELVGSNGGMGGVADLAKEEEELEAGPGAGGFGTVPEVDGVGKECIELAGVLDEVIEGGDTAEVLAFGALDYARTAEAGFGSWAILAGAGVDYDWAMVPAGMKSAVASPPVTV